MKTYLSFLFSLVLVTSGYADRLQYFYGVGSANPTSRLLTLPTGQSLFSLNTSTGAGEPLTLSSSFSIVSGELRFPNTEGFTTASALASGLAGKFDNPTGNTLQYLRGDGTLATFPTIPSAQVNSDWNASSGVATILNKPLLGTAASQNITAFASAAQGALADTAIQPASFNLLTGRVTTVESQIAAAQSGTTGQYMMGNGQFGNFGSSVASAATSAGFLNQAGVRSAISLTTTGINGAATYNSGTGVLNVPNYSTTPLSLTTTGVTGAATYNSGTGALNIPNYSITARSFNKPARSLNSAFQISTTQDAVVNYTVDIGATISLAAGQTGTVTLEYADNAGMNINLVTVQSTVNGNTGTLTIGLNLTQTTTGSLSGVIPAGKYVRIRTTNTSGTPTFTLRDAQEVLLQTLSSL